MKSLPNRPSYDEVDALDRDIQLSCRNDVLSKSFVTDIWIRVITRAIDDVALYEIMRAQNKELSEEEVEFESSANAFLFDEEHRIPFDDYKADIKCPKCSHIWEAPMSLAAGSDSICPQCNHMTSWKITEYITTNDQIIKDISLKELISLWGVEDIKGFRDGCRVRIDKIVSDKLESLAERAMKQNKKKEQMQLPHMPVPNPNLATPKPKAISRVSNDLSDLLEVVQSERRRAELNMEGQLEKAEALADPTYLTKAETIKDAIDSFKYIERMIEKRMHK